MRSFANLAVLASSLLVSEVAAGVIPKRDYYVEVDEVVVTAEVIVTDMGGGVYATGGSNNIATVTIDGTAVLVTETASIAPTSTPVVNIPVVATSTSEAAIFIEPTSTSIAVVVAPTSTTPAPVPTTSSLIIEAVPEATTLITSAAPLPTTTSTTPVAVPSSTTPIVVATTAAASSSSKRGVAYNDASLTDAFTTSMSWAYNWGSDSGGSILSTLEYVPMLWGLDTSDISNWVSKADSALASGSTHLLAFNEPDYSGQANLSPADAAAGYVTYMQPYASKAKLVGPAVTNGGGEMGLTWLAEFVAACTTCTLDAVAIHWYNGGTIDDFTYVSLLP